jgi:hypothetical protein
MAIRLFYLYYSELSKVSRAAWRVATNSRPIDLREPCHFH